MAHIEPLPAGSFANALHVVGAIDGDGPQLRKSPDHVDFLAVASRRLPDVLQLERPLLPREADIVRTGRDPRPSRHSFIDNWLRRGQIGGLNLVVLRTANRRGIYLGTVHRDNESVRNII